MIRKGSNLIFNTVCRKAIPSASFNGSVRMNHNLVLNRTQAQFIYSSHKLCFVRQGGNRGFSTKDTDSEWQGPQKVEDNPALYVKYGKFKYPTRSVDEVAKSIDTSLTPKQKIYVEKLKKMIKGGSNSPRSEYREVPRPEDLKAVGGFMPNVAENAEELIDWALSFIPPKGGMRGTRKRKRMALKHAVKRNYDAMKKAELAAAELRRQKRLVRIRNEVRAMKELAKEINAKRDAQAKQQHA
jgi:hypothetical protein